MGHLAVATVVALASLQQDSGTRLEPLLSNPFAFIERSPGATLNNTLPVRRHRWQHASVRGNSGRAEHVANFTTESKVHVTCLVITTPREAWAIHGKTCHSFPAAFVIRYWGWCNRGPRIDGSDSCQPTENMAVGETDAVVTPPVPCWTRKGQWPGPGQSSPWLATWPWKSTSESMGTDWLRSHCLAT